MKTAWVLAALLLPIAGGSRAQGTKKSPQACFATAVSRPAVHGEPAPSAALLESVIQRAQRSIVRVMALHPANDAPGGSAAPASRPRAQVASGVVVDREGHLLTTANTVAGALAIRVRTPDGAEVAGTLVGIDPATDLALLRIGAGLVAPLPFAPASAVQVGAHVITVAQSYGSLPTRDVGRVTWRYHEPTRSFIQMSNVVYPGNSGGAAIDTRGRLMGLVIGGLGEVQAADTLAERANARGRSFAVPVDELITLVPELRRYGGVHRGFLGVTVRQGLIEDPEHPNDPARIGVTVSEVIPGGPAWLAGLRDGDLVVALNGQQVNSPDELMRRIMALRPGSSADLLWLRNETEHTARVLLGATPDSVIAASLQASTPSVSRRSREEIEAELERLRQELERYRQVEPPGQR